MEKYLLDLHVAWVLIKNRYFECELSFSPPKEARGIPDIVSDKYLEFLMLHAEEIRWYKHNLTTTLKDVHEAWKDILNRFDNRCKLSSTSTDGRKVVSTYIIGDCQLFPFKTPPIALLRGYWFDDSKEPSKEYAIFLRENKWDILKLQRSRGTIIPWELKHKHEKNKRIYKG